MHRPRTFLCYRHPTCYLITIFSHRHTYIPRSFPYPDCSLFPFYHVALVPHVHPDDSNPPKPISTDLLVANSLVNPVSFLGSPLVSRLYIILKRISNHSNVWNLYHVPFISHRSISTRYSTFITAVTSVVHTLRK